MLSILILWWDCHVLDFREFVVERHSVTQEWRWAAVGCPRSPVEELVCLGVCLLACQCFVDKLLLLLGFMCLSLWRCPFLSVRYLSGEGESTKQSWTSKQERSDRRRDRGRQTQSQREADTHLKLPKQTQTQRGADSQMHKETKSKTTAEEKYIEAVRINEKGEIKVNRKAGR